MLKNKTYATENALERNVYDVVAILAQDKFNLPLKIITYSVRIHIWSWFRLRLRLGWVSAWLNLTAPLGTAGSEVDTVHISHVITAYTLESLSSVI